MTASTAPATVASPDLDVAHAPGVNLVWADGVPPGHLDLHPRFEAPLARAAGPFYFRGVPVEGFGVWSSRSEPEADWIARAASLIVHFPRYTDAELLDLSEAETSAAYNEHVVELRTREPGVSVVIATLPPGATLRETVATALSRMEEDDAHPRARLHRDEGLFVPAVDVVAGDGAIRFRLDDGGAAAPLAPRSFGLLSPPRRLECVVPFLVVVLDRPRRPVLAVWIENAEVLAKATPAASPAPQG